MLRAIHLGLMAIMLSACHSLADPITAQQNIPINLIPMYGHPEIEKTEDQKKADQTFLNTAIASAGSRVEASKTFAADGARYAQKGDVANAMRRFNQSWLLDPSYYMPHWGFGALLLEQGKTSEASLHFEQALSLLGGTRPKQNLLIATARSYSTIATSTDDSLKSKEFFNKSNSLLEEAVALNPQYGIAYQASAANLYRQGNYKKAWKTINIARDLGHDIHPDLIKVLSEKMPEPK